MAVANARPRAGPLVFGLTGLGVFLVSLDVSIANAVLPAIGRSFPEATPAALSWTITAYAIAFAAALVPGGRVADRAGRRQVFMWGLGLFAFGSLVCGVSPSLPVLLLGRVLQGIGAAVAQPASLGLLLMATDPELRAHYTARWFGSGALGIGLGPLAGGLATAVISWRWAFLVNVPLVTGALALTPGALAETPRYPGRRLPDPLGALLLAAAAALLALGIIELSGWGAGDPRTLTAIGAGIALTGALVLRCAAVDDPVLHLELLAAPRVARVTLATLLYSAGFFGLLFTFIGFLTAVWGLTIVEAGLAITPMAIIVLTLSTRVGGIAMRVGYARPLAAGAGFMAVGLLLNAATADGTSFEPLWLAIVAVVGLGIGLCYPLLGAAAVAGLPGTELAAATAINQCARQLGAALGIAVTVAVLGGHERFQLAWVACAVLCAAAAVCAARIE